MTIPRYLSQGSDYVINGEGETTRVAGSAGSVGPAVSAVTAERRQQLRQQPARSSPTRSSAKVNTTMRSRSNSLEDVAKAKLTEPRVRSRRRNSDFEDPPCGGLGRSRHRGTSENTGTVLRNHQRGEGRGRSERAGGISSGKGRDLSRDDLLFLLSMLEGELQARDEVITVLKAEKIDLALLEAQYGFVTPQKVLQALQRDSIQGKESKWQDDIYEKPMAELDRLVEKQRETYRRMLEQLLMVEQAHKQAIGNLEAEKRNHSDFMQKSDEFTNLLEQERERSVR
ncbi:hypothetical protein AGOR_G00219590 [Albula goreensis]|uniref:Cortactin-binding protein-2 N-terminal domain-containing protein n=1 Tax=Albula goreensis TaxID=1534307 RepID=A0A8T3CRT1_9TELE|nr:hypothetical protein AGOR_G00219590 [Albula goreensis]